MKIAVYGAGGVGGYYGAVLARAGCEVSLIARGAHLAAIRRNGLRVLSPGGDFTAHPAAATANPDEIGPVDAVVVAVKSPHLAAVRDGIAPLLGHDTRRPATCCGEPWRRSRSWRWPAKSSFPTTRSNAR